MKPMRAPAARHTRYAVLRGPSAGPLLLAAGAVLGACATGRAPSDPPPSAKALPVALELWGGPYPARRQDQVTAWNEAHPATSVRFIAAPEVGQGAAAVQRLAAAVAAKSGPHLLDIDRFQVASYANWRLIRPLGDHLRNDRIPASRFLAATLDEATGVDGGLYGLPSSVDVRLLLWNKQRFAEAGLDPERPPVTWDQLRDTAIRLVGSHGGAATPLDRLGFDTQGGQASLHLFAWQSGGAFQTADGRSASLPAPANRQALEWLVDLVAAQGGWPAVAALRQRWANDRAGADGAAHPFLTGQLGMQHQIGDWVGDVLARHRPDLAFGAAAPPVRRAGDAPLTWSGGYSYVLARHTAAPDAAWAVMQWMLGEPAIRRAYDGERTRADAGGGAHLPGLTGQPALDTALLRAYSSGIPAVDSAAKVALELVPAARIRERSLASADLWDAVIGAQEHAISGQQSPARALEDHNTPAQRALDQAWTLAPRG